VHSQWIGNIGAFLSGSVVIGIIAHAVNTFPMPTSPIGRWFLGVIQYAVGQREQASKTLVNDPSGNNK
jgi:hypothetical protein